MRRWILYVSVIIIAFASVFAYFYIPETIHIHISRPTHATENASKRLLEGADISWQKWWPGKMVSTAEFEYQGYRFIPLQSGESFKEVLIVTDKKDSISSQILLLPVSSGPLLFTWQLSLHPTKNPISKFRHYFISNKIRKSLENVLSQLENFSRKTTDIYSFNISQQTVQDTLLLATKMRRPIYPNISLTDSLVNALEQYILDKGARATNPPMLHVNQTDSSDFEIMAALPIDKEIHASTTFFIKRMFPGNILVADVTGGHSTIQHAYKELINYKLDHHLQSPAKAYESMLTRRTALTDSNRWNTRVYLPVF